MGNISSTLYSSADLEGCATPPLARPDSDLIALIAGKLPQPGSARKPDESRALVEGILANWQILPSISAVALDVLDGILQPQDAERLRRAHLAIGAFAKAQIAACMPFLRMLHDAGIPYAVLKGGATAFLLYPAPYMRAAWDFDIAVSRHDLKHAESLAHAAGYVPAQQDPKTKRFHRADPRLRAAVEANHYELGFLMRRLQVTNLPEQTLDAIRLEPWVQTYWLDGQQAAPWCYAGVDIHHALSLDIGVDDLLARRRTITAAGHTLSVPDDAWLAAHLIFKLYWEGVHNYGKGLYQYADLVRLAPRLDTGCFAAVIEILGRHNMLAAACYVLRRLPMFGLALPSHMADFIDEQSCPASDLDPTRINDLGDMWPKLFGRR